MSYTACLFHIVFGTKRRRPSLNQWRKEDIRHYICGISDKLHCKVIAMNAMPDHVHLLVDLHSQVSLAKYVGTVKQSCSVWLKDSIHFSMFEGWSKEYYGVSISPTGKDNVIRYINNQEEHHKHQNFGDEIKYLVEVIGMQFFEDSFEE